MKQPATAQKETPLHEVQARDEAASNSAKRDSAARSAGEAEQPAAHGLPAPCWPPAVGHWPDALRERLGAQGCELFADAQDLVVVSRGLLATPDMHLVHVWVRELHAQLLQEQGRPRTLEEHFAGEDLA